MQYRQFSFLLAALAFTLGGCRSLMDPTFMPAGYTYHQNMYKSPTGPESKDIGYAYNDAQNATVIQQWRESIRDLLLKAKAQGLVMPQTVSLQTDLEKNAFQGTYDTVLRDELRAAGYILGTPSSKNAPVLFYSAYNPDEKGEIKRNPSKLYNDDMHTPYKDGLDTRQFVPPARAMVLAIGIVKNGHGTKKVTGTYEIPLYGYIPGAYVSGLYSPLNAMDQKTAPTKKETLNP